MSEVMTLNITVIGTGYVGLVSGVCYAETGNRVICVDNNQLKIDILNSGNVPIYEPGLQEIIDRNVRAERLSFTSQSTTAVQEADIVVIAVGTPPLPTGEADLQYVEAAARVVAESLRGYTIIAIKSTVPVGTNDRVKQILLEQTSEEFDIVSLPEFLREGTAVQDTMRPDRVVIGIDNDRAKALMLELHLSFTSQILVTDTRSAEMIKYASNAFLATKISFINEIANICEKVGADVGEVARGMGLDNRIGSAFLRAGIGYGGSCFPKDTKALIQIAGNVEYDFKLLKSVVEVNQMQRLNIIHKLSQALGTLHGKKIGIWGLAFKPGTDDVREAPSIEIVEKLIELGTSIHVYDPVAMDNFRTIVNHSQIKWCSDKWEAVSGCDAVCLLTEWDAFVKIDLNKLAALMSRPIMIDGRNVYQSEEMKIAGISYYPVGRSNTHGRTEKKILHREEAM